MMARLYNTSTGKWERWKISEVKTPWRVAWIRFIAFLRYINRCRAPLFPDYELDSDTLQMRNRKWERRGERFRKAAHAVLSMVEMQKFIG